MLGKALVTRETKEEEAETFRLEASLPPIIHSDPNRSKTGRIQTDLTGSYPTRPELGRSQPDPARTLPDLDEHRPSLSGSMEVAVELKAEEQQFGLLQDKFVLGSTMPPRRTANQCRVAEEDELDQRIEQIIDIRLVVVLERRLDVVVDRLGEKMGAQMETRQEVDPRRGRVPNSTANLEEIEYDSNSEGDATLFSEEDPSDETFFVAGGDGEAEYHEDDNLFIAIVFLN
ncbi:hypothetical protein CRG98_047322 [Punica granatum]|uniref:Uncharacterized protein n=1 Tax=Punica granatum TaxID=22663 RepID=A0A2I0HLW6_PUNGR|nr:hypothetical protein CRG98_047322 [Punica granatum]